MNPEGGGGAQLQDEFLQRACRDGRLVAIYLVGGVKLSGRVKGFDKFTVLLESKDQEQLIFKHAISTVSLVRGDARGDFRDSRRAEGPDRRPAPGSGEPTGS